MNHSTTSPVRDGDDAYDEERLEFGSSSPRWAKKAKKHVRFTSRRRVALYLLLTDLVIVGLLLHIFGPLITLLVRNEELFGARLSFSPEDPPYAEPDRFTIPRVLHQVAATEDIPDKWVDSQKSCKDVYRDFEYKLWTDEVAHDFLENEYPWFVETFDNYAFPIIRADAIRYFVLYHYGGVYLDMDTHCNATIPLAQIEADEATPHAVFKSTKPTGVSNDLMISSQHHPLFAAAISKLLYYDDLTRWWAAWQPYCAIMISAGPFFITAVIKNYLLEQPSLPSPTVQVVNATMLGPYITDLESASWHRADAQALMWLGDRPWIWFALGAVGLMIGLHLINRGLLAAWRVLHRLPSVGEDPKVAKLT